MAALLVLLTAALWGVPNDVVELVAKQDHILLGRYSLGQFSALLILTGILLALAALLAAGARFDRELAARAGLVTASVLLSLALASLASHWLVTPRYLERALEAPGGEEEGVPGVTRQRPPNQSVEILRRDVPPAARSYADAPAGYPDALVTLTSDARGFRNRERRDRSDIVAVGDSYTEGSMVSDGQVWTVLLERELGCPVYNAGISGGTPSQYLSNLVSFGFDLEPRLVLVVVYEGNDFKRHRAERVRTRLERFGDLVFEDSPLRVRLNRWLVQSFGGLRADASLPESLALDWMPVAVASPAGVHHYSFEPKRLVRLYWTKQEFERAPEWTENARAFREIRDQAERRGARVVFVYAPSLPHVVMPLVRDRVSPEELRAFAAIAEDGLPAPAEFEERFYARIDVQETVFREFCTAEGIEFVSTTAPLRDALARGVPAYFTYDPHWTPPGHAVVARAIAEHLRARRLATCAASS